jgi:hypothetical protein
MTAPRTLIAVGLALTATSALAGSFTDLPTTGSLRKFGAQSLSADQLYILPGPISSTDSEGFHTYAPPSYLTLLAPVRQTRVALADAPSAPPVTVGTFFDYVFRDTRDNRLVFGSRLVLTVADAEVNDIFRSGFASFSAAAAWTFMNDFDLRMYSAARTAVGLKQGADVFDPNVVDMRSDINQSEGNPQSGLFLIKSNAPNWAVTNGVLRVRQGGEEGQFPNQFVFAGYAPAAAVPEPSQTLMLLAGLGIVGLIIRRRTA